jgi:hypothetical protein
LPFTDRIANSIKLVFERTSNVTSNDYLNDAIESFAALPVVLQPAGPFPPLHDPICISALTSIVFRSTCANSQGRTLRSTFCSFVDLDDRRFIRSHCFIEHSFGVGLSHTCSPFPDHLLEVLQQSAPKQTATFIRN